MTQDEFREACAAYILAVGKNAADDESGRFSFKEIRMAVSMCEHLAFAIRNGAAEGKGADVALAFGLAQTEPRFDDV